MTKRTNQSSTIVVPATSVNTLAAAAPVAAKSAAIGAEAEVVVKAAAVTEKDEAAPVATEAVIAAAAPAPLAMVEPAAEPAAAAAAQTTTESEEEDVTPYIVGGVLLAGGILAVALSGGDDDSAPAPTPTPTNTVTFSSAATATIAENSAASATVIDVNAAGTQTGTITYVLGGTDAALFNIDAATGVVTFRSSPNFEARSTPYSITVTANSAGTPAGTATQTIAITVTNVNETPTFANATATATVVENTAAATVIAGTGVATDVDAGTTLVYSLSGADAALFNVNTATGAVTFRNSPDFEARTTPYTFNLVASDAATGGLSASQAVTVNVTNVNEAPVFAATTRTATLAENVAAGTAVPGSAVATDADAGSSVTYSLTGTDAARFTINPQTGVVSIIASPDFETRPSYTFNVVATDNGNPALTATQAVTLNITDIVNEGTVLVGTQNLSAAGANVSYLESAGSANTSTIAGFGNGDTITVDVPTGNYSFSNTGQDLIISLSSGGVASLITLTGALPAGSFVFNEFTAEQALGSNFFLQNASVPVPPASANNLDGSGAATSFNAANSAVTFTENANAANTTTITNFGTDDRIVVTNATSGYSFSNVGSDLVISFSNNGVANLITLQGAVSAGSFVFNEASAEAAVGADFFRYG